MRRRHVLLATRHYAVLPSDGIPAGKTWKILIERFRPNDGRVRKAACHKSVATRATFIVEALQVRLLCQAYCPLSNLAHLNFYHRALVRHVPNFNFLTPKPCTSSVGSGGQVSLQPSSQIIIPVLTVYYQVCMYVCMCSLMLPRY